MEEKFQIADSFLIEDLETLKVLADSRRISILKAIGTTPLTVKQISNRVGLPPTKLYYHMNMLEKNKLIQVAETRIVSGIIEKLYTVVAKVYRPSPDLLMAGDLETKSKTLETVVFSVMDNVRDELLRSFEAGTIRLDENVQTHERLDIASTTLELSDEEAAEFDRRLQELVKDIHRKDKSEQQERKRHSFFFVRFQMHEEESD